MQNTRNCVLWKMQLVFSSEVRFFIEVICLCIQHNQWHHWCYIVKLLLLEGTVICFPPASFTDL